MNADAAVPHVIASGETVFLRAGDEVTILRGRRRKRARVVNPAATRKGEAALTARLHYRTRGPGKNPVGIYPREIVALGWDPLY